MTIHVNTWIDAYLDDELTDSQRQQVEIHLAGCPQCRDLLNQRQALSMLLREYPAASQAKPPNQFVAEVGLQLPCRETSIRTGQILQLGWWSVPLLLMFFWAFLQTVLIMSGVVQIIPGGREMLASISSTRTSLLGLSGILQSNLIESLVAEFRLWGFFNPLNWDWMTGLVFMALISLVYLIWLVSWQVYTQHIHQ
jgi:hypothetical protein